MQKFWRCNVSCYWNSIDLAVYSVPFDVSWVKCFAKVFPFFLVQFCRVSIGTFLSIDDIVISKESNIIVFTPDEMITFIFVRSHPNQDIGYQFCANFLSMILLAFLKKNIKDYRFVCRFGYILMTGFPSPVICWLLVVPWVSTSSKSSSNDTSRC